MSTRSPLQQQLSDAFAQRQIKWIAVSAAQMIGDDPGRLWEAWQLYVDAPHPLRERLSWAIWLAVEACPAMVGPDWVEAVAALLPTVRHPAEKRYWMLVMLNFSVPETCQAAVIDLAFAWIADPGQPVAARAYAMEVAWRLAQPYPELLAELALALRAHLPYGSPGFKNRGQKILARIEKR